MIEPVKLNGNTITNVTGMTRQVHDNNIGPGAQIIIALADDIIPRVLCVILESKSGIPQMPDFPYVWSGSHENIIKVEK